MLQRTFVAISIGGLLLVMLIGCTSGEPVTAETVTVTAAPVTVTAAPVTETITSATTTTTTTTTAHAPAVGTDSLSEDAQDACELFNAELASSGLGPIMGGVIDGESIMQADLFDALNSYRAPDIDGSSAVATAIEVFGYYVNELAQTPASTLDADDVDQVAAAEFSIGLGICSGIIQ